MSRVPQKGHSEKDIRPDGNVWAAIQKAVHDPHYDGEIMLESGYLVRIRAHPPSPGNQNNNITDCVAFGDRDANDIQWFRPVYALYDGAGEEWLLHQWPDDAVVHLPQNMPADCGEI